MTRRTFATELEQAADRIADVSRADLQILLRRAALRLRNVPNLTLDEHVDEAVDFLAAEMNLPRPEVLRTIIRDWLISGGRLPVDTLDEKSDGTAKFAGCPGNGRERNCYPQCYPSRPLSRFWVAIFLP